MTETLDSFFRLGDAGYERCQLILFCLFLQDSTRGANKSSFRQNLHVVLEIVLYILGTTNLDQGRA